MRADLSAQWRLATGDPGTVLPPRDAPAIGQHDIGSVSAARDLLKQRHGMAAGASAEVGSDWSDFSSEATCEERGEPAEEVQSMHSPFR